MLRLNRSSGKAALAVVRRSDLLSVTAAVAATTCIPSSASSSLSGMNLQAPGRNSRPRRGLASHTASSRGLVRLQARWSSSSSPAASTSLAPPDNRDASPASDPSVSKLLAAREGSIEKFERLGLNKNISKQLIKTFPHIVSPTSAQRLLVPAMLSPNDLIVRAHTGTGKSFGILLALLAKPRIVFSDKSVSTSGDGSERKGKGRQQADQDRRGQGGTKLVHGVASLILVPSNELANQYMGWAKRLFPSSVLKSLDPVIQCLVRGQGDKEEEHKKLRRTPPHIIVATPNRIKDILQTPEGRHILGIDTLRSLVLDEADSILQLPGRFPSQKSSWKHSVHKTSGLQVLNEIMKIRPTFSGGERFLSAGLENRPGKRRDEKLPPESIRRLQYQSSERDELKTGKSEFAPPKSRRFGATPLQLVCVSATANSVLRHFLGARTGWLRAGVKEEMTGNGRKASSSHSSSDRLLARWIDLTGLSGRSMIESGLKGLVESSLLSSRKSTSRDRLASSEEEQEVLDLLSQNPNPLPKGLDHMCVVVDEAPLSGFMERPPLRNLDLRLTKSRGESHLADPNWNATGGQTNTAKAEAKGRQEDSWEEGREEEEGGKSLSDLFEIVKPDGEPEPFQVDEKLIEALAFCFASEGVSKGLALIPSQWSIQKTRIHLEALGVPVKIVGSHQEEEVSTDKEGGKLAPRTQLHLLHTSSARGLDLASLSHVFLVGFQSVLDAVHYTHLAGRVGRIGQQEATSLLPPTSENRPATTTRPKGKVVTLIRGVTHGFSKPLDQSEQRGDLTTPLKSFISTWESRMALVYRRLGVVPRKFDLSLLSKRPGEGEEGKGEREVREEDPTR
ncbi:P-loop containing nucleoside triphosphate hydrolase protein [Violaceomyces palustris]|uniref:P-loop containing nucleoside triphosphate hydrolase protein n=1 Tax=Violaceomyces palustris TaxID=1673888 RepID=A0ACD0NLG5_9BASI|nr:P-loop containing nucleoside triphosphate hydrolase protein [Violaceomyces palustris]